MPHEENEPIELVDSSGNVFADVGLPNADELQLKADLAVVISRIIREKALSQAEAALIMGIKQPEVSLAVNGKLRTFSIEKLLSMAKHLGCNVHISLEKSTNAVGEMHLAAA